MMTREEMISRYETATAARAYIIGFEMNGNLYTVYTNSLQPVYNRIMFDRAAKSHGGMAKIRLRLDTWTKARLLNKAINHGSAAVLNDGSKYNRGERFERFIYKLNGLEWSKDSVPFWKAGDIELNGVQVQIKFDGAEISNENILAAL